MTWLRFGLGLVLVLVAVRAGRQLIALELTGVGTTTALDLAQAWDSSQPEIYFKRGLLRRDRAEHFDLAAACRDLATAARLNPVNWLYHLELGRCREAQGLFGKAERSLRRSLQLNPRSGRDHWGMANYYLRRDQRRQAVAHLIEAATLDPDLEPATLVVLHEIGMDSEQLTHLWPLRPHSQRRLLDHLLEMDTVEEPFAALWTVWERVLHPPQPLSPWQGRRFLQRLMQSDPAQARSQWVRLAAANGLADRDYAAGVDWIWNGRFELAPTPAPLDWRIAAVDGADFERTSQGASIVFDGTVNVSGTLLEQLAVVPPGVRLELSLTASAHNLSTDEGPRLEVLDSRGARELAAAVQILGSSPSLRYRRRFQAPESGLVRIRITRSASDRIDNRISGRLHLHRIQLTLTGEDRYEDLSDLSDR